MSTVRVQTGAVEPVQIVARDQAGGLLVGKTDLFVRVRRASDGFYLDHSDQTFKASGWTTLDALLTEADATNSPGLYELTGGLDTGATTNPATNDNWTISAVQSPGTDAVLPGPGELKIDQHLTQLLEAWRRLGLDAANEAEHKTAKAGAPGHVKVPASGSLLDLLVERSGDLTTVTRQ